MSSLALDVESSPAREDIDVVFRGLEAFNTAQAGEHGYQPLCIFIRDEERRVRGGITGGTYWGWWHIEFAWLQEELRGQGWGSRLLQAGEREAIRRGCRSVFLDPHEFQAPGFYLKHGFEVVAAIPDFPPGHKRIYLRKALASPGG